MLEKIKALELEARKLEPDPDYRAELTGQVNAYAAQFLNQIESSPAYQLTEDKGAGLLRYTIREDPYPMEELIHIIDKQVDTPGLNPASGRHLGYIPGGGVYAAALGDYLADVANRYAGVFYGSPGAVRMENYLVRWMADLVGYPEQAGGTLLSGGSLANLTGIVAAREAKGIKAREVERSVIYLTEQVHHCVQKALRIAGLGEAIIRYVNIDPNTYHLIPEALAQQVKSDLDEGLIPWLVVATTGTTDTGALDPVDQIADICEAHDLWLHVDAAYGGFFILTEQGKQLIKGLDRSDSIVMDPHKGLFLPYGTGALIIKEREWLYKSHFYQANYMQDAGLGQDDYSPANHSPELTRHYRGLRMWMPLMLHGLAPFRACLEEKIMLTRYFHEKLGEIPGMERGPVPPLSVALYRYIPKSGDADAFNRQLQQKLVQDGSVFISSTLVHGKYFLRLAVLSFRTHLADIDLTLKLLKEKIEETEAESLSPSG